jgi:hypothetical protein
MAGMRTPSLATPTRRLALAVGAALALSACAAAPAVEVAFPGGCGDIGLTDRRCARIVDVAAEDLALDPSRPREVRLGLGPACPSRVDERCIGSREPFVIVRFAFADGVVAEHGISCYGVGRELSLLCADPPAIYLAGGVDHDIPCPGEPPDGCATPVPTIDPATLAGAMALEVSDFEIPLPRVGHYDVLLGTAILPNGVLSQADYGLVESHQAGFLLEGSVVRLVVRDPSGHELGNVYTTRWTAGVVEVTVSLVFDVVEVDPGTSLHVRDVSVR